MAHAPRGRYWDEFRRRDAAFITGQVIFVDGGMSVGV
jgi:hypothetical protein